MDHAGALVSSRQFLAQVTEPQVLVIASERLLRNFPEIEESARRLTIVTRHELLERTPEESPVPQV